MALYLLLSSPCISSTCSYAKSTCCAWWCAVPVEYFCALDANGRRQDADQRPELARGSVEFVAPQEYMVRPPMPPAYLFVIDVSANAVASGMLPVRPHPHRTPPGLLLLPRHSSSLCILVCLMWPAQLFIRSAVQHCFLPCLLFLANFPSCHLPQSVQESLVHFFVPLICRSHPVLSALADSVQRGARQPGPAARGLAHAHRLRHLRQHAPLLQPEGQPGGAPDAGGHGPGGPLPAAPRRAAGQPAREPRRGGRAAGQPARLLHGQHQPGGRAGARAECRAPAAGTPGRQGAALPGRHAHAGAGPPAHARGRPAALRQRPRAHAAHRRGGLLQEDGRGVQPRADWGQRVPLCQLVH